jgi:hypothetical protein
MCKHHLPIQVGLLSLSAVGVALLWMGARASPVSMGSLLGLKSLFLPPQNEQPSEVGFSPLSLPAIRDSSGPGLRLPLAGSVRRLQKESFRWDERRNCRLRWALCPS